MKILIIVPFLSGGGGEFVASQWARFLAAAGDEVTVYATHPVERDEPPPGVSLVGAERGNIVAQTWSLARYLRAAPVDYVLGINSYSNLMSIAAARSLGRGRPRVVISQHTLTRQLMTSTRSQRVQQRLARRIYRFSDLLVAVSHPVGAEAMAEYGLSRNQIAVVPNPALAKIQDWYPRGRAERVDGDAAAHEPSDQLDIVVAGRLTPEKRPALALEVAASLSATFPAGVTVHYFGEGHLQESVVARADALGVSVKMHGWVPNWFDECPEGAVVLVPSIVEGFGNVLIEAAAVGLRSVASSRCFGVGDAVVAGVTGELICGDSVDEYAKAVRACVSRPVAWVDPWLQRFSLENSGSTLRDAMFEAAQGRVTAPSRDEIRLPRENGIVPGPR